MALLPRSRTVGRVRWESVAQPHGGDRTRRLAVGPVEVAVMRDWIDLGLGGHGMLLLGRYRRDPAKAVEFAERVRGTANATCRVLVNTRPLFLGCVGRNLAEWGVGRHGGLLTYVTDDLRRLAAGAPTGYSHPVTGEALTRP